MLDLNIVCFCSQAIQNPGDLALQEKAWNAVCPLVAKLKRFYEFSLRLGESHHHTHTLTYTHNLF